MLTGTTVTTINLIEGKPGVTLTAYVAGTSGELAFNEKRKAMLVIPGGAYAFCSDREADPIAHAYLAAGFNTFILRYSVYRTGNPVWPSPLVDASAAMKYIRDHAEELHIDPEFVFVIGFSAGGTQFFPDSNMHTEVRSTIFSANIKRKKRQEKPSLLSAKCQKKHVQPLSGLHVPIQPFPYKTPCFLPKRLPTIKFRLNCMFIPKADTVLLSEMPL